MIPQDTEPRQTPSTPEPPPPPIALFPLVMRQVTAPEISRARITGLAQAVEHALTGLLPDVHRQALYTPAAKSVTTYVEQTAALASIETLASLTRRTRARLQTALTRECRSCTRCLMNLLTSLAKEHTFVIAPLAKEAARQAIERELERFADYLINRLVVYDEMPEDERAGAIGAAEPINLQIRRKAALLREYGYVQNADGLYVVCRVDGEEKLTLIGKLWADVLTKRHIYTVPDYVTEPAKEQGVVLLTQFAPLTNRKAAQTLEIYRSDMLSRQPKFTDQIQAVKPPHKRQFANFIDALEAMAMAAPVERRYNATGLLRTEHGYVFLHPSGGALSEQGLDEHYQVQFPLFVASRLTSLHYGWRGPATTSDEQIADYRRLLQLLSIAPGSPGYGDVLLGVHTFAPFSQLCTTGGVWAIIHGGTGSLKSATSRLCLQGYVRDFSGRTETSTINLREGTSTPYAAEQVLYYLAGMFAHLDDGLKGNNVPPKDVEKFYKLLSTIGGHAVTRQGGKRGTWGQGEGGLGMEFYPRGSGVYTVETLPDSEGHASDLARYVVVSLDGASCVDTDVLSSLQEQDAAEQMNRATCLYLMWLLPRMEEYLQLLSAREEGYRELAVHTRTPTSYAKLETGIAAFLSYGVAIGALAEPDAAAMLDESRARLVQIALRQKDMMGVDEQTATANNTVTVFYRLIHQALKAHKLYVSDSAYQLVDEREWNESEGKYIVTGQTPRPQPPRFLPDIDVLANDYGWRWDDKNGKYILAPEATEAGVLRRDGAKITLRMYVSTFETDVARIVRELAKDQPLPGIHELVNKLVKAGKLTRPNPTRLHGRKDENGNEAKTRKCYDLDMTPEPENIDELATSVNGDGTLDFDLDD